MGVFDLLFETWKVPVTYVGYSALQLFVHQR